MWIFNFLPNAFWYGLGFIGFIGLIIVRFLPKFPYVELSKIIFGILILTSFYFVGALHNNQAWQAKVDALKVKVAELEVESAKVNTKIVTKVVTKTQKIREKGSNTIEWVAKEVVKYDSQCKIPDEFVSAHNQAAGAPK